MRRSAPAFAFALLVVLAGCGAPGTTDPPETAVSLELSNDHDEPYRVTVAVVPDGFEAVDVSYANGTTRRVDADSLSAVPRPALDGAVGFTPVGPGVESDGYDLAPSSGIGTTLDAPRNATLVYVVGRPTATNASETLRSFGSVTCGDSSTFEFALRVSSSGSLSTSNACR